MNIFVLDRDPAMAAYYHCDQHVVKMILETAQILSTVWHDAAPGAIHWREGSPTLRGLRIYKPTHSSHPCVLWAKANAANYCWLHSLGLELLEQYRGRYGKIHNSTDVIGVLDAAPERLPMMNDVYEFVQCMPDQYKCDDAVEAYRAYYKGEKSKFARWRLGAPEWMS